LHLFLAAFWRKRVLDLLHHRLIVIVVVILRLLGLI
jgi:hypothetical protein